MQHSLSKRPFLFARHGSTDWNDRNLCQGQKDIPLNDKGQNEATKLAVSCRDLSINCIVTTPLKRAYETAEIVHKERPNATLHIIEELSERGFGELEGSSSAEMYAVEEREEKDSTYAPQRGVEERSLFQKRVNVGLEKALQLGDLPLIVSHGRVFVEVCALLNIPLVRQIANCQLVRIVPTKMGWETNIL